MRVTRLNSTHKNQLINFINKRDKKSLLFDFNANIDSYLDSTSKFPVLFGAFIKTEIVFTLGIWRWEGLPYATINFLLSKPGHSFFNPYTNGFNLCFNAILEYGCKNNILAYYFFRKKRSKFGILDKKYFSYTEAIIPKNTKPKDFVYWEMMEQQLKPFEGEIRRVMPKPEFLNSLEWL